MESEGEMTAGRRYMGKQLFWAKHLLKIWIGLLCVVFVMPM